MVHLVMDRDPALALLLTVSAFLGAIYYGALTLRAGSVWPAVVLHAALNGLIGAAAVAVPDAYGETVSAWMLIIVLQLPMVLIGFWLLRGVSPRSVVPDAP